MENSIEKDINTNRDLVLKLVKKYHEIALELLSRRKFTTDVNDIIVIDLQIITNERFLTDLTRLIADLE